MKICVVSARTVTHLVHENTIHVEPTTPTALRLGSRRKGDTASGSEVEGCDRVTNSVVSLSMTFSFLMCLACASLSLLAHVRLLGCRDPDSVSSILSVGDLANATHTYTFRPHSGPDLSNCVERCFKVSVRRSAESLHSDPSLSNESCFAGWMCVLVRVARSVHGRNCFPRSYQTLDHLTTCRLLEQK